MIQHVRERLLAEEVRRRDAILEAIADAAERLLATPDWEEPIQDVLRRLGTATEVSRVYVFENHPGEDGELLASLRYEWAASGVTPQIDQPEFQNSPLRTGGFGRWIQALGHGGLIQGHVRDFPAREREVLAAKGIRSIVVVPISVRQTWWGFIGFDECRAEREWSVAETEALRLAARTFAAAILRRRAEAARAQLIREQAARAEAEAAQRRLVFLADASVLLASSLDYEITLERVARLAVPVLADWCVVDVVDTDGTLRRLAVAHADLAKETLAQELRRYPPDPGKEYGAGRVLRTGQPELIAEVPERVLLAHARGAEHLELLRTLGFKSSLIVPLAARDRVLGAISFVGTTPGRYSPAHLPLIEELAGRCALAIDNARLYREAQQATRVRDEFLSVAAHELKTPVTSVLGRAQLLLRHIDRAGTVEPAMLDRGLRIIERQSMRLARLVEQLLDVARLESGRLDLERAPTDLVALVQGIAAIAEGVGGQRRVVVAHPEHVWAEVDALRMEQVVANLVDNALRYSPDGPIELELSALADGGMRISVRDYGPSIPEDSLERVFDRFYRLDEGDRSGGLGLGLSICKQIVELHGGRILADRPLGGGARFMVLLPPGATSA